jgi:hypothetical protein
MPTAHWIRFRGNESIAYNNIYIHTRIHNTCTHGVQVADRRLNEGYIHMNQTCICLYICMLDVCTRDVSLRISGVRITCISAHRVHVCVCVYVCLCICMSRGAITYTSVPLEMFIDAS